MEKCINLFNRLKDCNILNDYISHCKNNEINDNKLELKKEIGYTTETFMAFSGFNDLVLKVDRQSSKRLEEAKSIAKANIKQYLEYFRDRYNMIIPKLEELNINK